MNQKESPSMDLWLKEAKQSEHAGKIGMFLIHNGIVRETAKAAVRQTGGDPGPVSGMLFSCDEEKVNAAVKEAYCMEGHYVRPDRRRHPPPCDGRFAVSGGKNQE